MVSQSEFKEFPSIHWSLRLMHNERSPANHPLAAVGFCFGGSVTRDWLEREVSEANEIKGLEEDDEQ